MNYVNNKELLKEILGFYETDFISEKLHLMFYEMCKRIITRPRYNRYTPEYREEMISESYLKCLEVLLRKTFNPEKSNAFSYFTSVISNMAIDVAKGEKRQFDIKDRITEIYNITDNDTIL